MAAYTAGKTTKAAKPNQIKVGEFRELLEAEMARAGNLDAVLDLDMTKAVDVKGSRFFNLRVMRGGVPVEMLQVKVVNPAPGAGAAMHVVCAQVAPSTAAEATRLTMARRAGTGGAAMREVEVRQNVDKAQFQLNRHPLHRGGRDAAPPAPDSPRADLAVVCELMSAWFVGKYEELRAAWKRLSRAADDAADAAAARAAVDAHPARCITTQADFDGTFKRHGLSPADVPQAVIVANVAKCSVPTQFATKAGQPLDNPITRLVASTATTGGGNRLAFRDYEAPLPDGKFADFEVVPPADSTAPGGPVTAANIHLALARGTAFDGFFRPQVCASNLSFGLTMIATSMLILRRPAASAGATEEDLYGDEDGRATPVAAPGADAGAADDVNLDNLE